MDAHGVIIVAGGLMQSFRAQINWFPRTTTFGWVRAGLESSLSNGGRWMTRRAEPLSRLKVNVLRVIELLCGVMASVLDVEQVCPFRCRRGWEWSTALGVVAG